MDTRQVVLIVTPDDDLRQAAARVLTREGYRVRTAAHAGHAWLACLQDPRIDVLAAELASDEISGPALAARLRRRLPDLPAVYFGHQGTADCEGVLVRPFTSDDLFAALALATARSPLPAS